MSAQHSGTMRQMSRPVDPCDPCPEFPPQDENGVDLSMIRHNLRLTPAERLAQNDRAAAFMRIVQQAGQKHYGMEPGHSPAAEQG